uniref:Mitochondrial Carrier (MC) Family putative n=1 Tax=Albugo laibachii Nc14 TaxID=890382 RepID=F0WR56_9STRA|nr:Mitochondrial Carrier (MC) Family putative [Albugo laibachii Nc14]|eukprot:CCA23816.1 Mitochondrial Carrier (MC) Family putative [Albugo laibachii Nc14]
MHKVTGYRNSYFYPLRVGLSPRHEAQRLRDSDEQGQHAHYAEYSSACLARFKPKAHDKRGTVQSAFYRHANISSASLNASMSIEADKICIIDPAAKLGAIQNAVVGSLAGMTEILIQQPTIAVKNAIQQKIPIKWTPSILYRGVGVTLASVAPCTAIQFGVNGKLLSAFSQNEKLLDPVERQKRDDILKVGCATVAGFTSAFMYAPGELVMTLQQNTGKSFRQTIAEVLRSQWITRMYRGFDCTAARESIWCASYMALGPAIAKKLHDKVPSFFGTVESASIGQQMSASATASIMAGILTVYATQPFDTVKTLMQGEALQSHKTLPNSIATAQRLWKSGGIQSFYRGTIPRGVRLIGAVIILGQSKRILEGVFLEQNILGSIS